MGDKPATSTTPIRSSSSHPAVIPTAPRPRTCGFGRSPQIPQCLLLLQFSFLKISLQNRMCGKSSSEHQHPSHSPRQARRRGATHPRDSPAPVLLARYFAARIVFATQNNRRVGLGSAGPDEYGSMSVAYARLQRRQVQHPLSRINADEADRDHGTGRGQNGRWSWRV